MTKIFNLMVIIILFMSLLPIKKLSAQDNDTLVYEKLTKNTYCFPKDMYLTVYQHQRLKYVLGKDSSYIYVNTIKHPDESLFTWKELNNIVPNDTVYGKFLYKKKVEHKHQTGEYRYYLSEKYPGYTVLVTILPGLKTATYIVEYSTSEDKMITPSIIEKSEFKHSIFKNHAGADNLWLSLLIIIGVAFVSGLLPYFTGEKIFNGYLIPILSSCIVFVAIFLFIWYFYGSIFTGVFVGLLISCIILAITLPSKEGRSVFKQFLKSMVDNMG
ncbi:MAG: hypothetical protein IJ180_02460 [Bacteroidales bacterium]|nr:hypothetical protein [Bacteroidales bacterium]